MKSQMIYKFFSAILIVMLAISLLPVTPARAATFTVSKVTDTNDGVCNADCSLREAIVAANAAAGADTIILTSGSTYALTLVVAGTGDLDVTSEITVTTSAAGIAIIDPTTPGFNERVFDVSAAGNLTLDTIRITTAITATDGAAVLNAGTLTIQDGSEITNNTANAGGGGSNGGGINSTGTLSITNTTFTSNSTTNNGGAIYINGGTATISSSTFNTQNAAAIDDGAAIYLNAGTLTINGSTLTSNATTNGDGGAIYQNAGTLTINGTTFTSNAQSNGNGGGGIYQNGGTLSIGNTTAVTFTGNTSADDGGAIHIAGGTLTVNNTSFTNSTAANSADEGGAIYHNSGTLLTVTNSTFTGNTATNGDGGAIMMDSNGSSLTMSGSTFTSNSAEDDAGAIFSDGEPISITTSTFTSNSAGTGAGGPADGGAIRISGNSTSATSRIHLSTFTNNFITMAANETVHGGAITVDGTVIIANVTFSGNSLSKTTAGGGDASGGAVYSNGITTIHNSTFSGNSASESGTGIGSGGSIFRDAGATGALTVANTILNNGLENGGAGNCGGTITNGGNNITYSANDCGAGWTNSDPLLGALTGTPAYFPLNTGSSAIGTGNTTICTTATSTNDTSQNGVDRITAVTDTICDIGSYETPPNTPPTGTDNTITINEDATHTFAAANFGFNDVDAGSSMSAVRIDTLTLPAGATLQLSAVNVTAGQVILTANIPNLVFTPAANANGTGYASFTFSVRDNNLAFDTTPNTMTFNVTAVNDEPSFTAINPPAVNEDAGAQTIPSWATFNDGDPEVTQTATFSVSNLGVSCATLLSTTPTVNSSGQLSYTPAANQNGTCTFDVQVQDNGGVLLGGDDTSPTQNFTITVNTIDDISVANDDTATVAEDAAATTINVRSNDTDIDSAVENITSVTQPTNGTVVITNAGADLTYQPNANYCNNGSPTDDFTYTLAGGDTATVQVTVTCVDDISVANDDTATVAEDSVATTINVRGNDTDIDSAVENITSVTQPTNGTVVITNAGADLTYQPDANYCNNGSPTDDFTYTLTNGDSATVAVTVTCIDDASIANDDSATVGEDASATTINVRGNDTDIDSAVENITSVTQPTNGTVVITNAGADLTYQPNANYCNSAPVASTDNFTYTLAGTNTATVRVTVTCSDDISVANDDTATVWEDSGANTINVRLNDTDIDSTVELITSVVQPTNGTVVITNAGADLTYQPNAEYCNSAPVASTDNFTYNLAGGDTATVQVTVNCQTAITANITANNKVYDGDNTATFTCLLTGVTLPDVVTCTGGTATFADKNVGTNKLVTATGLSITGADAFKYELASTSATDNADITVRTLNVTATGIDKVYDGNTNATVTLSDDRFLGDLLTVSYTSASFVTPNVGVNITINVSGISITGGADQANYVLGNTTAVTDADITIVGQTINVTTSAPTSAANGSSFNVAATATSGLPVTITVSGVCTISDVDGSTTDGDATITITSGTGTCSVFYNQAGDTNYTPAPQVQEDVTATESPLFTSADNTSFDLGFVNTFNITATGNPSTMTITVTGALPTGITFTDNGDGTASFGGTPAAGTAGIYNLVLTANNGVNPNGTQNFTLTIRNGPTVNTINSIPNTGNGSVSENESILNTLNITQLIVVFNRDVYDPAGDTDPDDVTNPANYILVRSATGTFATSTCDGGVVAPDVNIAVDYVTYDNITFTATLDINGGLPLNVNGFYRLFVCGTTSIADATNPLLTLAGDGVNPGTDFTRTFQITAPTSGGGGGGNNSGSTTSTNLSGVLIPVTGFTPNQITKLPAQSIGNAYTASKLRIEIPSLSMDLPIVGIALKDKQFDVTWLGNNAGYLEGSAYPTWQGNSILTGHVTDANGKPGPFAYVNELSTGDQIYIQNNGFTYVYEVRESKLILPNKINELFKSEEDYWLTLVTCENFNVKSEIFTHRRIIRAVLISIIPEK